MRTYIKKWGNSQGLRLAKNVLEEAELQTGVPVEVSVEKHSIVIRKAPKHYPTLTELVAKIPRGYKPDHRDLFGKPMGQEIW